MAAPPARDLIKAAFRSVDAFLLPLRTFQSRDARLWPADSQFLQKHHKDKLFALVCAVQGSNLRPLRVKVVPPLS